MPTTTTELLSRTRLILGDEGQPFRASFAGDGVTTWFDLPVQMVSPTLFSAFTITGTTIVNIPPANYVLDERNGNVQLVNFPLDAGTVLVMQGTNYGLFTDDDLTNTFINDAVNQHTLNRTVSQRIKDNFGFINLAEYPMDLTNLPDVETPLIAMLAALQALWALAVDASTDIDVITAEGTHVPRSQRWSQLVREIEVLEGQYKDLCAQLNAGLWRIEVFKLRRTAYVSGRLVPIFSDREYDDQEMPIRQLPPIDHRNQDTSGIPSPLYPWGWGP